MDLKDKTVVVTGGASGIGLATAQMFAQKGATAVIADLPGAAIDEAVAAITGAGGKALAAPCNVAKETEVEALMAKAVAETGRLDVVVLCAGVLRDGLLIKIDKATGKVAKKLTLDQWQTVIDVNLTGVFLCAREAAAQMVETGNPGVIIPIASMSRHGSFGQSNYSASKAGVASMVVVWSKELLKYQIRTVGIAPGFIETPMVMKDMQPAALEKAQKAIPIGRMGRPDEIAHTALYIAENDLVTGITIDVGGGIRI